MMVSPFTLRDESGRAHDGVHISDDDVAGLCWTSIVNPDGPADNPEVTLGHCAGAMAARIYARGFDSPIVTVTFTPEGRVADVLLRRHPSIPVSYEEAVPSEP